MPERASWTWTVTAGLLALCSAARAQAPPTVNVSVDATAAGTPLERVWPFHGYDEINYTTVPEGQALLGTIAAAHSAPVHVRSHFLLNTGDGTPALKWGSTNVYTEDAAGNPVYNWTLTDGIMDTITAVGAFPFVEIGFMPEALSTHPTPYRNSSSTALDGGCFYPPTDYTKWAELDSRVGDARERTLSERRGELAVGAVERARHRLLERHVRRLREALRLHGIGAARGDPGRAARRSGGGGRRRRLPDAVPPALRDRHQRRHRRHRNAPGSRDLPREGRRRHHRRPRRDGPGQPAPASPCRLQRGRGTSPSSSRRPSTSPRPIPTAAPPAR